MRLPGAKAARQLARWLRSRVGRGALILGYHRVDQAGDDPYGVRIRPEFFAEHLAVLRQVACPLPLDQVLAGLSGGALPPRAVAITFDDAYSSLLTPVLPLLERFDIPATVFVPTGYLGREFWWDELARLAGRAQGVQLEPAYRQLLGLPPAERDARLAEWRTKAGAGAAPPATGRCLTAGELVELSRHPLISLGSHSVTHPVLAAEAPEQQQWEAAHSKACLEDLIGRPVTAFSYPNGSHTPVTQAAVRTAGYAAACNSAPDVARPSSNSLALPRFWPVDGGGEAFRRWLARWLPGR